MFLLLLPYIRPALREKKVEDSQLRGRLREQRKEALSYVHAIIHVSYNEDKLIFFYFYRPLSGGRSRTHFVSHSLSICEISHLEASNAKSAQSKDV